MSQTPRPSFLDRLPPGAKKWYLKRMSALSPQLQAIKRELLHELDDLLDEEAAAQAVDYVTHLCIQSQSPRLGVQPVLAPRLEKLAVLFAPDARALRASERKELQEASQISV